MLRERLQYLVNRYFNGTCTEDEQKELARWIDTAGNDSALKELLEEAWSGYQPDVSMPEDMSGRILSAVFVQEKPVAAPLRRLQRWWPAAAAAVMLLLAGAGYLLRGKDAVSPVAELPRYRNEVPAGGNKAVLTLGDGTVITLDSAANGVLARQGNINVVKTANGQLSYQGHNSFGNVNEFNTMRTPRGGEYRLTLPDGTLVWLNAASSITFPVAFASSERAVKVTGEVYFEVAHNPAKPFRVTAGNTTVEVLGTHFNINAYQEEEAVRTTLLEGAVKISTRYERTVLDPGQQARVTSAGRMSVADNVDLDEVMAWKNGYFQFNDADMASVMRQLANWYDITVTYEDGWVPERSFGGGMQRSLPLTKVLKILEENNVRFKIEGRNITVLK
ncbi:FecR family protein [Chitinophaga alhagiae]|uniref:FecR family protein n=1 Tax=Chitinophaga alhagiae TaxID=2203219 RepID=UPI000E5B2631|nr:FecR family protein [Chitinophaga alhagiae]